MKTYAFLTCLIVLNLNCNQMKDNECFETKNFDQLKTQIVENNDVIQLHERLVADTTTSALELSIQNKFLELVRVEGNDEIIVIDKNGSLPTYSCAIVNGQLKLSAYESRFDTEQDVKQRRNDWCKIVNELVLEH
jgi:hypothetical protein